MGIWPYLRRLTERQISAPNTVVKFYSFLFSPAFVTTEVLYSNEQNIITY